jgi:FkbM family methyltransferase
MKQLAPIVLFVYNRPWHTQQTLDALAKNTLALDSELIVFCDGPKEGLIASSLELIEKTREIVKGESRFHSVQVVESKENKGLADSIIGGVTEVVNQYGKIIVLEDDLITSPGFLQYMNDALWLYENESKVMHVSGYMFPVKKALPETFFIKPTSCWGWGTWKRAWDYFEKDVEVQIKTLEKRQAWKEFTFNYSFMSYKDQLVLNKIGKINTWAIFWHASVFLKKGLSLHPSQSLVQNIGFDGTGVNCEVNNNSPYIWGHLAESVKVSNRIKLEENLKVKNTLINYFTSISTKVEKKYSIRDKFYLYRNGGFKQQILKINYALFSPSILNINSISKVEVKEEIERFVKGSRKLFEKDFEFVDLPSFNFIYDEVFNTQIYKFNAKTNQPLIIDCGANIGLSVLYFKKLYPDSRIIGFEPDPKVFKTLSKNILTYNLENVELIQKALWDNEGEISFFSEGADAGRIEIKNNLKEKSRITLETDILSKYLKKEVDFLKIDIEGAEYKVLNECKDRLKLVQNIFIEYHSFENQSQNLHDILEILSNSGFRYYISSIGVRSANPFVFKNTSLGMDNQLNIFGTR